MTPEQAVVIAIFICLGGAVVTLLASANKTLAGCLALLATAGSAGFVFFAVVRVLSGGLSAHSAEFLAMHRYGFALRLYVDGLTAFFLALAALISLPAALYSIRYMRHYKDYSVARYYPYFLVFLAAMYGLVSTTDMMWFFFMFWQMMTLPGYAMIRFEYRNRRNVHAANKFLLMMQIACAATMIGAEILAAGGAGASGGALKYDFDTVCAHLPALLSARPALAATAFALFLMGFGIKMGMWPFGQVWLPDAHPAAPSPVSAMLSGVMIKTGVYGLVRYFLWLVPQRAWPVYPLGTWGAIVAALGVATLFTGTMQALKQEQTKRLLAFHSIGQIGYILLGIGACMALLGTQGKYGEIATMLAGAALIGALFHVLNHGLFKALLFLNAGSLVWATDTQDLNAMGGLVKFMPLTAITALIASLSISGVPLFNGFASKWTIYAAAIQGGEFVRYLPTCALVAILTSALTLASFIKFFGTSFLSVPSNLVKARAAELGRLEVGWSMQLPQVVLAACCVGLGLMPALAINALVSVIHLSQESGCGAALSSVTSMDRNSRFLALGLAGHQTMFAPLVLAATMAAIFLLVRWLARIGQAPRRIAQPWLCGYAHDAAAHRYVAHNFYTEIKRYFGWLGGMPRHSTPKAPLEGPHGST